MLILGVDAGNHFGKVAGPYGEDLYRSAICEWFERKFKENHGTDDMEFEIDGRKGFAGSIAVYEDEFGGVSMYGDSKAHEDAKIRVLLAIYRYINKYCPGVEQVSIVTGQPIERHIDSDKKAIKQMLEGKHYFKVDGKNEFIEIEEVNVVAEACGAFWGAPTDEKVRIIDIGSGTINAATIVNKSIINTGTKTFRFGMDTLSNRSDPEVAARGIIKSTTAINWQKEDTVLVCGGIAQDILPYIMDHYKHARVLVPNIRLADGTYKSLTPMFANAAGFYQLARLKYL